MVNPGISPICCVVRVVLPASCRRARSSHDATHDGAAYDGTALDETSLHWGGWSCTRSRCTRSTGNQPHTHSRGQFVYTHSKPVCDPCQKDSWYPEIQHACLDMYAHHSVSGQHMNSCASCCPSFLQDLQARAPRSLRTLWQISTSRTSYNAPGGSSEQRT